MPRALASLVKIPDQKLSRHEFYVHLCDIILDIIEQDTSSRHNPFLARKAHALGHDLLNLATLAGRLLWYEGVTPNLTRSPDLVSACVDAENCIILLRSACDILAEICAFYCVVPKDRGKVPQTLNDLFKWAKNTKILRKEFEFLTDPVDWFYQLRKFRDDIVHYGWGVNIYTERDYFRLIPDSGRVAERKWLREAAEQHRDVTESGQSPEYDSLLAVIQSHARSLLEFTDRIAVSIEISQGVRGSKTHALSGVFIPALHHLNSYQQPISHTLLDENQKQQRKISAWYLIRIGDYAGAAQLGYPNGYWWRFVVHLSALFVEAPVSLSGPSFSIGEILQGFYIIFKRNNKLIMIFMSDNRILTKTGLSKCQIMLNALASETSVDKTLLISNSEANPWGGVESSIDLVTSVDPIEAAGLAFSRACS